MKCLGISLPIETKDLFAENYKTRMNKINDDTMERYTMFLDWKNQYCENNYTFPKTIYRFNAISIKLARALSTHLEEKILYFVWEQKRLQISKEILEKEKWSWRNQPS